MGGSGCGWQWRRRRTVKEVQSIDALWLHRIGLLTGQDRPYLEPLKRDGLSFAWRGTSLVAYQGGDAFITPLGHFVLIDRTPCRYGGTRPWFRCPACGHRRRFLYQGGSMFVCRLCSHLTYRSCQRTRDPSSEGHRAEAKQQELEARLRRARSPRRREQLQRRLDRLHAIRERADDSLLLAVHRLLSKRN
jgi:hypothetical protein